VAAAAARCSSASSGSQVQPGAAVPAVAARCSSGSQVQQVQAGGQLQVQADRQAGKQTNRRKALQELTDVGRQAGSDRQIGD
jgi:hypothetical protein